MFFLKEERERLSLVVFFNEHQDTVELRTKTVKNAVYVLCAIANRDVSGFSFLTRLQFAMSSLVGKRIDICRNVISPDLRTEPNLTTFEAAVNIFKQASAIIFDNTNYGHICYCSTRPS